MLQRAAVGNPCYELLDDWHAHCRDDAEFPDGHFGTLLMELFYDFGAPERRFIHSVFEHVENGEELARIMCKSGMGVPGLTERQIKGRLRKYATGDIEQKLPLLKLERQARLAKTIARLPISVASYPTLVAAREDSDLHEEFDHHVSNAITSKTEYTPWQYELSNAVYYGYANDLRFQQIFDTYMLDELEPLGHDFELWVLGGECVITDCEILVAKFEPPDDALVWPDDFVWSKQGHSNSVNRSGDSRRN